MKYINGNRDISIGNGNISTKTGIYLSGIAIYQRKSGYIYRKLQYIDENRDISIGNYNISTKTGIYLSEMAIYQRKPGYIYRKLQYISENRDISPKNEIYRRKSQYIIEILPR
ncbi:hypothetical protein ACDZ29_06660 [Peribacillus sp. RS7]|uniref:hypothetical protein n=1 Tax=Peribacillus sp. RS7 TaxID=3242679 RepID=UPI0035BF1F87